VDLVQLIGDAADRLAASLGTDRSLLVGITAVSAMTLQQVGHERFTASDGKAEPRPSAPGTSQSPEQIMRARARDDSQGVFGFLKGERKTWTVTYDEANPEARFSLIQSQELTTAAASDPRDHRAEDSRCHEGAIPAQCRSAFCGTCWVGILGGEEKLSPVADLERRRIREFGYITTDDPKPIIRLACQAQAFGAVSIVIPPWNGILGRSSAETTP
jgi:ferredoxin